jgi:ribosomal protein L7/L12
VAVVARRRRGVGGDDGRASRPSAVAAGVLGTGRVTPQLEEELRALLVTHQKHEAVERAHEATGLPMRDARALVDRLEGDVPVAQTVAASAEPETPEPALARLSPAEVEELRGMVRAGHTAEAIRIVRERTRVSPRDARDYVESL